MRPIPESFESARVSILGLGKSGVALARVLGSLGARLLLSDTRSAEALAPTLNGLSQVEFELETGGHSERIFRDRDLVVVSPGVPVHHPIVQAALAAGVPVAGEVEVAYRLSARPFVAVTGTNGKSTTVTLLGHILKGRALVAGNIGTPLVSEVVAADSEVEWIVAEVSSFQLETVHRFHPRYAVLTNFSPDHLDRHPSLEEYRAAKARVFEQMGPRDVAVVSADDPGARELTDRLRRGDLPTWLAGFPSPATPPAPRLLEFSVERAVPDGIFLRDMVVYRSCQGAAQPLFEWSFPGLPGPHNAANALAAVVVATELGVAPSEIQAGLRAHRPLHYRLEQVGTVGGITFVNDSKATNVASVVAALRTYERPVVLIAGGKDKGLDFAELAATAVERAEHLLLIGEAAARLGETAERAGHRSVHPCASLAEAVKTGWSLAAPGQTVLLSPACSSFDMFENAEDRGRQFNRLVEQLGSDSEVTSV